MTGSMKLFLAALFFVAVIIFIIISNGGFAGLMKTEVMLEHFEDADKVERLAVQTASTDIEVVPVSADQIKIALQGKASRSYQKKVVLDVKEANGTLEVRVNLPDQLRIGFSSASIGLRIELPEKIYKELQIESTSGDIQIQSANFAFISLKSTSGDIAAREYTADLLKFKATSGDVRLSGGSAELQGETTSGDMDIRLPALQADLNLVSSSGDIGIRLEEAPSTLNLDFRSSSGDGRVRLDGFQYETDKSNQITGKIGNGDIDVKVRTSSGDFSID